MVTQKIEDKIVHVYMTYSRKYCINIEYVREIERGGERFLQNPNLWYMYQQKK